MAGLAFCITKNNRRPLPI